MEFASRGLGVGGLTTGIIGTALGVLNSGGLNGILNVGGCNNGCGDNALVNRYEATQNARIAELETEVKLRDANTYSLGEVNKLRDYVDRRFDGVNSTISAQAVINAQMGAALSCAQGNIATLMALTKTVVPADNICPSPMPMYNSWTAPTATT